MIKLKCASHFDYCIKAIRLCEFIRGDVTLDNHKINVLAYVMTRWKDNLLNKDNIHILAEHFDRSISEMVRIRSCLMESGYVKKKRHELERRKYVYTLHKNLNAAAKYEGEIYRINVEISLPYNG